GATQYEYKLENAALGYSQSFAKTNNNFNLAQFTGLANSTTYTVQVRLFFNGVWGPYGAGCTVTTPASAILMNASPGSASAASSSAQRTGIGV
ncbi:fibronectin type III domain-containing protein, partial [Salmonella enterica]|uniref:fibronectin type III domain-containing protein n=1 Tax=Salmonella enterica TaxID=28901 RepID=UPI0020A59B90